MEIPNSKREKFTVVVWVVCQADSCQGSGSSLSCKWLLGNCSKVPQMTSCKIGIYIFLYLTHQRKREAVDGVRTETNGVISV